MRYNRELKHQSFLVPRTPTGSIFAAWQPLRMSRRSWAAVTDFKTRVLRLKPEVQILGSSKSIRHTKVQILPLKSCFLCKKETELNANPWKAFSTENPRPAMPFVNQEPLVLKFPKHQRFWAMCMNRKWAFFSFNILWRHQICIAKSLYYIETIYRKVCSKSQLKSAKSLVPVDVRRSKTSLLKLPTVMWR